MKTTTPPAPAVHPFKLARRAGVPVIALETPDPAATISACCKAMNSKYEESIVCRWDIIRGLTGVNDLGEQFAKEISPDGAVQTGNPSECLSLIAGQNPKEFVLFFSNAHRFIGNESVAQAVWNLRDPFKYSHSAIVLLAPSIVLPEELRRDAITITEELPGDEELGGILDSLCKTNKLPPVPDREREQCIDTMLGLSAFESEQTLAMAITKDGINQDVLWSRKVKVIEQTPGLSVWKGRETFDDLGGLTNLKQFLRSVLTSERNPVRSIYFCDEVEKALAGSAGDTSGTSQDQLQSLLTYMQDKNVPGMILIGHCGCGKSAIAKAAGGVAGCPVLSVDFGAMKGSLVGQSEERIRAALRVGEAISQGKAMFIFTCNKIGVLPPEFRRRCTLGTFFVDLPDADEQVPIWQVWIKKYELPAQALPECEQWTGAEIRACCDVAWRAGLSLLDAAKFVVPVIKAAPDQVKALREQASGRYISASYPGAYQWPPKQKGQPVGSRNMNFD